jgi:hypothetical protein
MLMLAFPKAVVDISYRAATYMKNQQPLKLESGQGWEVASLFELSIFHSVVTSLSYGEIRHYNFFLRLRWRRFEAE